MQICGRAGCAGSGEAPSARLWLFGTADRQGQLAGCEVSRGDRNVPLAGQGVAACNRLPQVVHAPLIVVLGCGKRLFRCHGCMVGRPRARANSWSADRAR